VRWRDPRGGRPQAAALVPEPGKRAGATGADDQIFTSIPVQVVPGDARPELAEGVGQEQLASVVVEVGLGVVVAAKLVGDVLKQGRGRLL